MTKLAFLIISVAIIMSCQNQQVNKNKSANTNTSIGNFPRYYYDSKPYIRWWWFASEVKKEDVAFDLQWLKDNGFGGVEIAWVYPLNRMQNDTVNYTPRYKWQSKEWSDIVAYAKLCADSLGLGCDFTFGTLWPFGDLQVYKEEASQVYSYPNWRQEISRSWDYPKVGLVIDHLKKQAFKNYASRMGDALKPVLLGNKSAIFVDSWEVESKYLWTDGFEKMFETEYGYSILPFMKKLYNPGNGDVLYDYMKFISKLVIDNFYIPFTEKAHELGALSRGQCSGAPCDILSAYATIDIPESEAMLYEPAYSIVPASAAALTGKPIVSSETFTCLYGWPGYFSGEEQTADLKLVADALFANGVNQIIWHGKPLNPAGYDTVKFYATVHVGASGQMAPELSAFNKYMETISTYMKKGQTYSRLAVYIPLEDSWYGGELPKEKQFIWAWGDYEFRYRYIPEELKPYRPLWVNRDFLKQATVENKMLKIGEQHFNALYVDVEYIDFESLKVISQLARQGLPVILKKVPLQAGHMKKPDFRKKAERLLGYSNVSNDIGKIEGMIPLVEGEDLPDFWCRKVKGDMYFFFSNPASQKLEFPISYGQSYTEEPKSQDVVFHIEDQEIPCTLVFKPYQSLLLKISNGKVLPVDLGFKPKEPIKKGNIYNGRAPWKLELLSWKSEE